MNKLLARTKKQPAKVRQYTFGHGFDHWRPDWPWKREEETEEKESALLKAGGGPTFEVTEDNDMVRVDVELPGMEKDDFTVEVDGNRLIVKGEKRAEKVEKGEGFHYTERRYGAFYQAVPLTTAVDAEKLKANYKKGVLTVTLPKTEDAKAEPHKVEVN